MRIGTQQSGRSHAAFELEGRFKKARKIEMLLGLSASDMKPLHILDVGAGSGIVAHWFALRGHDVVAVDVVDQRVIEQGYQFQTIVGVSLPFPDFSFDVVISNHVIEHVGDDDAQRIHLSEIRRVLKPTGQAYLAMPNKWMLVEPHYGLPFLSWLPRSVATCYVRLVKKGDSYDCRPLSAGELEKKLRDSGLLFQHQHGAAIQALLDIEYPQKRLAKELLRRLPLRIYQKVAPIFPTLIYKLVRSG